VAADNVRQAREQVMTTCAHRSVMGEHLDCAVIEIACATYFNWRRNLIVPNVSWGLGLHECDLVVMTGSRKLYEVEIKTSLSDLRRDASKRHGHGSGKITRLYFAMPMPLCHHLDDVPERAGVLGVETDSLRLNITLVRAPRINRGARSLTPAEAEHLYKLAAMRVWTLKQTLRTRAGRGMR
jgi:hypothetical protein